MNIGLTGGIGCGKSAVRDHFAALGIEIICADTLAREIVAPNTPCLAQIAEHFGDSILTATGELDRQQLKHRIFSDPDAKTWLEQLLHPTIRTLMRERALAATSPYVILEIPLLFETAPNPILDRILVVDCSEETQIARVMQRDKISREAVEAIMKQQVPRDYRLAHADDVIDNDGNEEALVRQVNALHAQYLQMTTDS